MAHLQNARCQSAESHRYQRAGAPRCQACGDYFQNETITCLNLPWDHLQQYKIRMMIRCPSASRALFAWFFFLKHWPLHVLNSMRVSLQKSLMYTWDTSGRHHERISSYPMLNINVTVVTICRCGSGSSYPIIAVQQSRFRANSGGNCRQHVYEVIIASLNAGSHWKCLTGIESGAFIVQYYCSVSPQMLQLKFGELKL